jgi:hypothetical protein
VPDILGTHRKDDVLGNVAGMVTDPFQATTDKDHIEIGRQIPGVVLHPVDEGIGKLFVDLVEFLIPGFELDREIGISFCKGTNRVVKHGEGETDRSVKQVDFVHHGLLVELARTAGNIHCLVSHSFNVCTDFDGGDDFAQIRGNRLKPAHDLDSFAINLHLQQVDFFIVGDAVVAPVIITLKQSLDGVFEI